MSLGAKGAFRGGLGGLRVGWPKLDVTGLSLLQDARNQTEGPIQDEIAPNRKKNYLPRTEATLAPYKILQSPRRSAPRFLGPRQRRQPPDLQGGDG